MRGREYGARSSPRCVYAYVFVGGGIDGVGFGNVREGCTARDGSDVGCWREDVGDFFDYGACCLNERGGEEGAEESEGWEPHLNVVVLQVGYVAYVCSLVVSDTIWYSLATNDL
jgi:hypothetical protein